jgi:hypothetical protein
MSETPEGVVFASRLVWRSGVVLVAPVLGPLVPWVAAYFFVVVLHATERAARREAQVALAQVKQLHGLLPICAWCKRVRNDANYWEQIESYITQRSEATFSHGICPACHTRLGRELDA